MTPSERDALAAAAIGLTCREHAAATHRKEQTIKFHRHNVIAKLGAKNTTNAVYIAIRDDLISAGDVRFVESRQRRRSV